MKQIWIVFKKEVMDNLRDKRSVFFALLYGPVLLPLLMVGPMAMGVKKYSIDFDEPQKVHMLAPEAAPNFVQFLSENNVLVESVESDFEESLKSQKIDLVIELSGVYEEALRKGVSAAVTLHYNRKSDQSEKAFRAVSQVIWQYNHRLAATRLSLRGLDPAFIRPIEIVKQDLGEVDDGAKAISMIVPFIIVLSLTMGGFYLAVDSTAGERERHSLEPLLSLSISRLALVLGKLLTLMLFVATSALLAISTTYLLFAFLPVEELQSMVQVELLVFAAVFFLCLPMVPFFTTAMMLIATFARDTKEAQTHLGLSMMVPMAPFFIIQFANLHQQNELLLIPVMSQFILIEQLVTGENIAFYDLFKSAGSTLVLALVFFLLIISLYRRENILGK